MLSPRIIFMGSPKIASEYLQVLVKNNLKIFQFIIPKILIIKKL